MNETETKGASVKLSKAHAIGVQAALDRSRLLYERMVAGPEWAAFTEARRAYQDLVREVLAEAGEAPPEDASEIGAEFVGGAMHAFWRRKED